MTFTDQERYELWRHVHGFDRYAADEEDYRGYHRGPDAEYGASMDSPEMMFPDIYEHPEYYDTYQPYDHESHSAIRSARGNPDKKISIYRALPLSTFKKTRYPANDLYEGSKPYSLTQAPLNSGDWVTPSYSYAKEHGESNLDQSGPWTILHHKARAGDLYSEGNSIHEWAYNGPSTSALESSQGLQDRKLRSRKPRHASRRFTAAWSDYDDYDQRRAEEDAMWEDHDDEPYTHTPEELDWLGDDSSDIPVDPEVEAQARQDAAGSGWGSVEDDALAELAGEKNRNWATYENLIPPKDFGRNGARPPMTMEPIRNWWGSGIMARHAADGRPIGHLMWSPHTSTDTATGETHHAGEIASVNTHPDFAGRGVASAMLHHARSNPEIYDSGENPIHHSSTLTPYGHGFASSDPHHTMPPESHIMSIPSPIDKKGRRYSNYLSGDNYPELEYIPVSQRYAGQSEDYMKASGLVGKGDKLYGQLKPPPRQYVPPGQGHLGDHWGPRATTMDWGGNNG